jgi:demethylmenaquinone methyltransferase/2-methoxy-6-polyprenyl-1,4-benzoquinol methylase
MDRPPERTDSTEAERREMFAYYEARADTYDEFYHGKGPAIAALSHAYPIDTAGCLKLVSEACRGNVLDLACGTGFWLQAYAPRCTAITLIDQSSAVLERCRRRLDELEVRQIATIVQGDVFKVPLPSAGFDAAVVGFFLSHLTDDQLAWLFARIREALRPNAVLTIVDSGWSDARVPYCRRDSFERRTTPDGNAFSIRKRYFTRQEIEELLRAYDLQVESTYQGDVFVAVAARVAAAR